MQKNAGLRDIKPISKGDYGIALDSCAKGFQDTRLARYKAYFDELEANVLSPGGRNEIRQPNRWLENLEQAEPVEVKQDMVTVAYQAER